MSCPRLIVAGTGGDSGKTLTALGLVSLWRNRDIEVVPFKKGPDYIDPAWLASAAGRTARNLDTWMMGMDSTLRSFSQNATRTGINLIEGNRGLHDGEDAMGSHSTATLAKLLRTPIVLVLPAVKITRSAAAIVLGMRMLDADVPIAGVILNRMATKRQAILVRQAVENETGIPVLGAIPRVKGDPLPGRHLGLITPQEHGMMSRVISYAADLIEDSVDVERVKEVAFATGQLPDAPVRRQAAIPDGSGLTVGYFYSTAFTFYYPENLEALRTAGMKVIQIDPLANATLPDVDVLYIGGGFPETHAAMIAKNKEFLRSVRAAVEMGLPVWAECGGLMFLARSIRWKGTNYKMCGAIPVDIDLTTIPQGHGYVEIVVDEPNPFLQVGTIVRGHEFHYSRVREVGGTATVFKVKRGVGLGGERDGLSRRNIIASYLHVHASATPEWTAGMIEAASTTKPGVSNVVSAVRRGQVL